MLQEKANNISLHKTLPHNIEAEQILLGSIIINSNHINHCSEFLTHEHFFMPIHQKIYKAIENLLEKEMLVSVITLHSILVNESIYQDLKEQEYLILLTSRAASVINPFEYGKIIYDLSVKRNLIELGENIVNNAYNTDVTLTANKQLEDAEDRLYNLANVGINEKNFAPIKEATKLSMQAIEKAMNNKGEVTGISVGLTDLDSILSGFQNSDLVILAGRPSMGKTAFAINFAYNACNYLFKQYQKKQQKIEAGDEADDGDNTPASVGFFSLEMSSDQIASRILSMVSSIDSSDLKRGTLKQDAYNNLKQAANKLNDIELYVDDTPALSISAIRTRARKLKRKHNLGILFIDYLQLIRGNGRSDNRVLEISEITQGLKALAKELNIPIIALSQLSRAVEQRVDNKPMLSDLRESGSIEQDSDVVMFVYREEYYLTRQQPSVNDSDKYNEWQKKCDAVKNQAEIIIAKHRNGSVGNVKLSYMANISKVGNLAKHNYT